jgi:uncharacterized iron-regulated membrane protein
MRSLLDALRRVLFWSHLTLGVAAGLVILLMASTGVLLGFERQTIALVDGAPRVVVPAGAERLPVDALLGAVALERAEVASLLLRADPREPLTVRLHDGTRAPLLVDPYRGTLVEAPSDSTARRAMAALRRWHRWVGAEAGAWRTRMKAVTGAANLAFLLLVLSGLWLWWPRRLTWSAVRAVLWFRRGLSPKARDFNWHNTIGFWSALPLALVVASGVFISYRWPGLWLDRLAGSAEERAAARIALGAAPARATEPAAATPDAAGAAVRGREADASAGRALAPLQSLVEAAAAARPAWQSLTVTLPTAPDGVVAVAVAEGNTYRPDRRTTVRVDARSAAVLDVSRYGDLSRSRRVRAWVRYGHTGEVFGLAGQLLATLASLGGVFLVLTGLALSVRRFAAWRRRRAAPPPELAAPAA